MKRKIHQDIYICIFVYAFAATMLLLGQSIKNADSKIYPFLCIGIIIVLNTILLITALIKTKKLSSEELDKANTVRWNEIRKPMLVAVIVLAYVVIFDLLGYFIATGAMLVGLMWLLGVRDWKCLVLIPVGLLLLIYFFFVTQLHVPLM